MSNTVTNEDLNLNFLRDVGFDYERIPAHGVLVITYAIFDSKVIITVKTKTLHYSPENFKSLIVKKLIAQVIEASMDTL